MPKSRRRHELRLSLDTETYHRVTQESASRALGLAAVGRICLKEYFTLRDELASSLGMKHEGRENRPQLTILHSLLSEAEHRIQNTLERHEDELTHLREEVGRLAIMVDAHYLGMMLHLREPPEPEAEALLASAVRRHEHWRSAVSQTAKESAPAAATHPRGRQDPTSDPASQQ